MIANITTGSRPGDIGAYLHGPGKANEHTYTDHRDREVSGGVVIGGTLGAVRHTEPTQWAQRMRQAIATRPEARRPVWHASLRNTENDRILSNDQWADAAQDFAQRMGFDNHPWVAVRHGQDHIHLVVSRVDYEGQMWSRSHDWRKAQRATSALEDTYRLEKAPRQRTKEKQPTRQIHDAQRGKAARISDQRRQEHERQEALEEAKATYKAGIADLKARGVSWDSDERRNLVMDLMRAEGASPESIQAWYVADVQTASPPSATPRKRPSRAAEATRRPPRQPQKDRGIER